jgi:tRNA G10  N-methylase Trm11
LLEGLSSTTETSSLFKILARKLVDGARHNTIAPKTRICITTTPLCSIAAYLMCNIALIQENLTILDPFAGSAATLLAATLISPSVRTVGIEIESDESISRSNIRRDFSSRGLAEPVALLHGDIMDPSTRDNAREAIGNRAFDVIITDPPYGRREAMSGVGVRNEKFALNDLIDAIGHDRCSGNSLLRPGGRLVAFLPCPKDSNVLNLLPSQERLSYAGLELLEKREQKLNDSSRWMVSFISQPIAS